MDKLAQEKIILLVTLVRDLDNLLKIIEHGFPFRCPICHSIYYLPQNDNILEIVDQALDMQRDIRCGLCILALRCLKCHDFGLCEEHLNQAPPEDDAPVFDEY